MTPRDPEVLASRWRLDDLLAGNRVVEAHAATDTDLGTEVVAVLWAEDPDASGRAPQDPEITMVDCGVADGVWFAIYTRLDGAPLTPAAKAALARSFVPDQDVTAVVAAASVGEGTAEVAAAPAAFSSEPPAPAAPLAAERGRRGLVAAGIVGLLVLLAAGGLVLGRSSDGGSLTGARPPVTEATPEPLEGAMGELRAAASAEAGPEGRTAVAAVERAVRRRDWPAARHALVRLRRLAPRATRGRPGRLVVAIGAVRAALPGPDQGPAEVAVAPCGPTTTSSLPTTSSSTTSSTSTTTTTSTTTSTVAPARGVTTTTAPCRTTTTIRPSTTTTVPSTSSTTSTTSLPSTTTSTGSTSTTSSTTTVP